MTKEHNYYKETEYLLYNYKMFQISIKNMQNEIESLEKEDGTSAINYSGVQTSPTNKFSSSTESTALSISERIDYLEHSIKRTKSKLDRIDKAIEGLTEKEKDIITKKYIEGKQWYVVAYNVSYSERQCRNIRTKAIKKIAIGIFGEVATSLPHLGK
ncbi:hypothetical protein ACR77J_15870 [Tissierella praeacuta]|uniref:hypothetical protein n=1 Tax=Tissierella praeacuta TaxID=43131 RepID=UPI003DA42ABA